MSDPDAPRDGPDVETMLTPMAKKKGVAPRTQMVRKLADIVVLPAGRLSANERALVADILLQVINQVEPALRVEVAARVARVAESPPALVRMLLLDIPQVAEQIIRGAEFVPEALLIEAAREGAKEHRALIAGRKSLSTAVADAVLSLQEDDVAKLVLGRADCLLSPNAINRLVAFSAGKHDVQALLLRRRELEPSHGFIMFWWADAEQRKRILTRFAIDRRIIQDALADLYPVVFKSADPDPFVEEILTLADRRVRMRDADGAPLSMDEVLGRLKDAWRDPSKDVCDAIAARANISRELAARILRDPGGEPFAIICKSVGVSRENFFAIVNAPREEGEAPEGRGEYLLGVFDSMARDFARAVMRYWDWEGNPRIAYISRLLAFDDVDQKAPAI